MLCKFFDLTYERWITIRISDSWQIDLLWPQQKWLPIQPTQLLHPCFQTWMTLGVVSFEYFPYPLKKHIDVRNNLDCLPIRNKKELFYYLVKGKRKSLPLLFVCSIVEWEKKLQVSGSWLRFEKMIYKSGLLSTSSCKL